GDGIRDFHVTGVQTCALPISPPTNDEIDRICRETIGSAPSEITPLRSGAWSNAFGLNTPAGPMVLRFSRTADDFRADELASHYRSAERRVGKACRASEATAPE